jgi:hypothetical protein
MTCNPWTANVRNGSIPDISSHAEFSVLQAVFHGSADMSGFVGTRLILLWIATAASEATAACSGRICHPKGNTEGNDPPFW